VWNSEDIHASRSDNNSICITRGKITSNILTPDTTAKIAGAAMLQHCSLFYFSYHHVFRRHKEKIIGLRCDLTPLYLLPSFALTVSYMFLLNRNIFYCY
jgi:hypothetical protein